MVIGEDLAHTRLVANPVVEEHKSVTDHATTLLQHMVDEHVLVWIISLELAIPTSALVSCFPSYIYLLECLWDDIYIIYGEFRNE